MVLEVLHVGHIAVDDGGFHSWFIVEPAVVTVALAIGLGDEVDAPLVAEFIPARIVRVMAGADVVAVALLEQFQIADHRRFGNRVAGVGHVFVAVRALQFHRHAVHGEEAALDLDLAETRPGGKEFRFGLAGQRQHRGVKIRGFRRPLGGIAHRDGDAHVGFLARIQRRHGHVRLDAGHRFALRIMQFHRKRPGGGRLIAVIAHHGGDLHRGVAIGGIQIGFDEEIAHMHLRRAPESDVAEDAAQAPHVLILQVTARTEAIDLDGQQVLARLEELGEVEFCRVAAVHGKAHRLAVQPDVERRIHPAERDERATALPTGRHLELAPVTAHRVALFTRGQSFWKM
jgi:hypothetical protein